MAQHHGAGSPGPAILGRAFADAADANRASAKRTRLPIAPMLHDSTGRSYKDSWGLP